jgi:hypothetical protein
MIPVKQPQRLFTRMKKAVLREDMMALTQEVTQAMVLGQMLYWTKTLDKVNDWLFEENKRLAEVELPQHEYNYGWIYKSAREMREDLMNAFSEDAIQRAFSALVTKGVFMKRHNPIVRYDRKLQYRIDIIFLRRLLKDRGYEMTDFQLATIPQEAAFIPQGAVSMAQCAETITETITKITNKENLLTSLKEELESSAVASHSSVELNQPNLFPTNPSEANASGSATAKLKSADGKETTPHCAAPPRIKKSREPKLVDEKFIAELQRLKQDKDVEREVKAAQTWLLSRPDRKYTRGFLANWVIRSKNIINPDKFHNNNKF